MQGKDLNHGLKMVGIVALGFLALFLFIKTINEVKSYSSIGQDPTEINRTISVSGKAEIKASPDVATFNWTVEEESTVSMNDAKNKAATKSNAIIAYLEKQGVEKKNIKTTSYSASPKYKNVNKPCAMPMMDSGVSSGEVKAMAPTYISYPCTNSEQVPSGFTVSQSVEVKLVKYNEDENKLGTLISGVTNLKPKYVSSSYFTIEDVDKLKQQARADAIAKARIEAQILAKNLGVRLGKVLSFSDGGDYYPYPAMMSARAEKAGDSANVTPDLPTGEQTISSNVTITYTIK